MQDGYFAEYAIVDARFCAKLKDSMSYVQASHPTPYTLYAGRHTLYT